MEDFTKDAYAGQQAGSLRSAEEIVPLIIDLVRPRSVIDVGCGVGTWLSVFQSAGIGDIMGLDGGHVDPRWLTISSERFQSCDLTLPVSLPRQFDLVVSLEVAEHLPGAVAAAFVKSLTRLGPVILFSAAVPQQCGFSHLNEQWPEYWASLFRNENYVAVDCLRHRLWDNERVEWWYRQNTVFFVRRDRLADYPALNGHTAPDAGPPSALVHPMLYLQSRWATDPLHWSVFHAWSVFCAVAKRALVRRLSFFRRPKVSQTRRCA